MAKTVSINKKKRSPQDTEVAAIKAVLSAFKNLRPDQTIRVMGYVQSRIASPRAPMPDVPAAPVELPLFGDEPLGDQL